MRKNAFFTGMAAVVLAFITTLALVGCGQKDEPATSITISGTAKAGETLTAVLTNPLNPNGTPSASNVQWRYYFDAACIGDGIKEGSNTSSAWVIPSSAAGTWIRAHVYGYTGSGEDCADIYSNILGPVGGGGTGESVTISPTTASVAKDGTQSFTVTINEPVTDSSNVVWTVTPDTDGSTITGSGQSIIGSTTTQTRTLNVASGETATILTVTVTYNGKSATAIVAVTD